MEYDDFKEIVKTLNEAKPKREGFVMLPSVNGFDVYRLPEDLLRVFLHTQSALAEKTPTSEQQCAAPAVSKCEGNSARGLLLAYAEWPEGFNLLTRQSPESLVDEFLSQQ